MVAVFLVLPASPSHVTDVLPSRRGSLISLFRYRPEQPTARSLEGLNALYLFTVNHPGIAKALPLQFSTAQQSLYIMKMVAKLRCCLSYRQGFIHLAP